MTDYELTDDAELDLLEIAVYTIKTWGTEQADRYEAALIEHFKGIHSGDTRTDVVLAHWPEVQVSRCQEHYVYSLRREGDCPQILAIFHGKMRRMARLLARLEGRGWGDG